MLGETVWRASLGGRERRRSGQTLGPEVGSSRRVSGRSAAQGGKVHYRKMMAEGKSRKEALRCLTRRILRCRLQESLAWLHHSPRGNLPYSLVRGVSVKPWAKTEAQMTRLLSSHTTSMPVSRTEKAE
jgi:hypothetical protein